MADSREPTANSPLDAKKDNPNYSDPPPPYPGTENNSQGFTYSSTAPYPLPGQYPPQGQYPPPQGQYPTSGQFPHAQYPPVAPGAYPGPPDGYPQSGSPYQQPSSQVVLPTTTTVVVTGGCPSCGVGTLTEDFSCCGILLAIFFFPIGLLCCFLMRQRRCTHCGASF